MSVHFSDSSVQLSTEHWLLTVISVRYPAVQWETSLRDNWKYFWSYWNSPCSLRAYYATWNRQCSGRLRPRILNTSVWIIVHTSTCWLGMKSCLMCPNQSDSTRENRANASICTGRRYTPAETKISETLCPAVCLCLSDLVLAFFAFRFTTCTCTRTKEEHKSTRLPVNRQYWPAFRVYWRNFDRKKYTKFICHQ